MSYALIDNASLTSVQRVLGQIEVQNSDTVNGDLVAFENIIQAILFYDELVCIDNYKPQFQQQRKDEFDYIRFLSPSDYDFAEIDRKSQDEARSMKPEIRGGEFADEDFGAFINSLKLNMVCTWDLRSSVYYLTMKMLGQPNTPEFEKYGEISSAIFNELSDVGDTRGFWSKAVDLFSSEGVKHTEDEMQRAQRDKARGKGGTTNGLDMFIASLNWLAYKSIYYSLAAKYFRADTFLHPIRHGFQMHWMQKSGAYGHDFSSKLIQSMGNDISTSLSSVIDQGRTSSIALDIPTFSAWMVTQTGDVSGIIQCAQEIKKNDEFVVIRELLREIRIAYDEEGLVTANKSILKWEKGLVNASAKVKSHYGLKTDQGVQGSQLIKVVNSLSQCTGLPSFPEIDFKVPLPGFIQSSRSKSFVNVYKDITKELTAVERLGGVRDMLGARFNINDEYGMQAKVENPKFRWYSSDWKLPM